MRGTLFALAALAAALPGTASAADGTWTVRNGSQTRLMCALRLERGSAFNRFSLDPGETMRQTRESFGRERVLTCQSTLARRTIFRIRAGFIYELIETGSGALRLRTLGAN